MTSVTLGKSRVRESRTLGSVRAKAKMAELLDHELKKAAAFFANENS
jgi:hypothetical protein